MRLRTAFSILLPILKPFGALIPSRRRPRAHQAARRVSARNSCPGSARARRARPCPRRDNAARRTSTQIVASWKCRRDRKTYRPARATPIRSRNRREGSSETPRPRKRPVKKRTLPRAAAPACAEEVRTVIAGGLLAIGCIIRPATHQARPPVPPPGPSSADSCQEIECQPCCGREWPESPRPA